ncbi:MAG: hypothetical protein HY077_12730 [Elusimicrobia bacterium]|nr:hypothetical protein [Elusimicrobiota bacterium]
MRALFTELRRTAALGLCLLIAAAPSQAALIVRPGPGAIGVVTAPAVPTPAAVAAWTRSFETFLRSPEPDFASVKDIASALADYDASDPALRAAFAPLAASLQAELAGVLAPPDPADASETSLRASAFKLKVLNFPAVRNLLPESSREAVGAAAWAYNDHLWDRKGRDLGGTASAIASRLRSKRVEAVPDGPPSASVSGPDVELEVLAGDLTRAQADAVVAAVDEAGLCRGGVHSAIEGAGGPCYRQALEKAGALRDGQTVLARPDGQSRASFQSVLFLSDLRRRPLHEVVRDGLKAADAAGLSSVALPALRTGSVFGAVERSAAEIVAGLRRGVELFAAESRTTLKRISIVVHNDADLAGKIQAAFAGGSARERSLRTDLRPTSLSGKGFTLEPKVVAVADRSSPIYESILEPWSLSHLLVPHKPVTIGEIEDRTAFSMPTPSVLNMPIKMRGTGYRVPEELAQFREFLQKVIDHEDAVNPESDQFYAYLTVDQHTVEQGSTHRRPGVHIDGVQGARYPVKLPPEHLYSASDMLGTVFYDQSFDLTGLDPARQHVHAELERQAKEENARPVPDYQIAFWDSYSVHRADVAPKPLHRTFIRVEFSRKKYDSLGDTVNPLFDYDWDRVARPIPADLDDRPLAPSTDDSSGYPAELAAIEPSAEHTVKDLDAYLNDNLGAETVRQARAGKASFLIAVGEGRDALAKAEELGWILGSRVDKREGYHRVFEALGPDGRFGYVVQRVNGDDRVLHIQSLLKLAGAPAGRVRTVGRSVSWRERYRRVFDKQGYVPDLVVYGFSNTAIDASLLRNAFQNGRHFATLTRNYFTKKAAISGGGEDADDLDGMSMQVVELKDGRRIWFLHCMFGDLARDLVGAAVDHGAKNISFIGSAGSLEGAARMGEVVVPAKYRRADGSEEILDRLPDIPGIARRGTYLRVPTPNVGTKAWTSAARKKGVDLIESELGYVLDELKLRPEVRLQVALVIAEATFGPDGRDMTEWGLFDLRKLMPSLDRILDAALGASSKDYVVKKLSTVALGGRD